MANQGFHHPTYNPNGSKLASDGNKWYNTAISFTSIADCFTESKLQVASGYIGTTSARADGIFYDQVHESDILDLRNSSAKVEDYNRLIDREFNKLVAGTYRGSSKEVKTITTTQLRATTTAATYITVASGQVVPEGSCIFHNGLGSRVLYQSGTSVYISPAINIVLNGELILSVEY